MRCFFLLILLFLSACSSTITSNDKEINVNMDGDGIFFKNPTNEYGHNILGSVKEYKTIVINQNEVNSSKVFETLKIVRYDINGDGLQEIIVTESDKVEGSQIVVYTESGDVYGKGEAIGRGFRWRHVIGAGPFGPNGEIEIVVVKTPHIGGVVEYYNADLDIVATIEGFTSHDIGTSESLATISDFDEDGILELIIPNQAQSHESVLKRTEDGVVDISE